MLRKICKCGKIISMEEGRCESCKHKQKDRHKLYDKVRRNQDSYDIYHSSEWLAVRGQALSMSDGVDIYAYYSENKIVDANTAHHIEELNDNWDRRFDIENLIPVSDSSHNTIHALYKVDKDKTQRLLFEYVKRWKKEFKG